jgi:hypothetical protein
MQGEINMEKMAENRFTITKKLYMEAMLRMSGVSYGKTAGKIICLILGAWCAFLIYVLATGKNPGQMLGSLGVICAVALWILVGMPRYYARRAWRKLQNQYGTDMERSIVFYADHMEAYSESVEKIISYEDIRQIMQSKHLLILICNDKTGVLVARNGFSAGSEETVLNLIGK